MDSGFVSGPPDAEIQKMLGVGRVMSGGSSSRNQSFGFAPVKPQIDRSVFSGFPSSARAQPLQCHQCQGRFGFSPGCSKRRQAEHMRCEASLGSSNKECRNAQKGPPCGESLPSRHLSWDTSGADVRSTARQAGESVKLRPKEGSRGSHGVRKLPWAILP